MESAIEALEESYIAMMPLGNPEEVYRGIDIIAGCTDASIPVILGRYIENGTHVTSIGGRPDRQAFELIDIFLRLGNATPPVGSSEIFFEFITYETLILSGPMEKRNHDYSSLGLPPDAGIKRLLRE